MISEDAASLLEGQVRPALLWTIQVDETGEGTDVHVERALVRSTAKLAYESAQRSIDDGSAGEVLLLLKEIGELRIQRDAARGGVSLPLPEQEIDIQGEHWALEFRQMLPVELWNAQISLLTGFGAASLMVYARVGVLRTLPPPDPRDVQRLHRTAKALGIEWPAEQLYPDFIRCLDPTVPAQAAMVVACTRLLRGQRVRRLRRRGAGRAAALRAGLGVRPRHRAAAPPGRPLRRRGLRRAVRRSSRCPTGCWRRCPRCPKTMQQSGGRARGYENAVLDLVEAGLLAHRVGEEFDAVVVSVDEKDPTRGVVMLKDPGVEAPVVGSSELPLGTDVRVTLASADVATRKVEFRL